MDLLSIALILLVAWIAIIVVAVALVRAAGGTDAQADAEMTRLVARPERPRASRPTSARRSMPSRTR